MKEYSIELNGKVIATIKSKGPFELIIDQNAPDGEAFSVSNEDGDKFSITVKSI